MNHLFAAVSAEQQAIAIYEAQVLWRPGSSGKIFREILAEERQHMLSIKPFLSLQIVVFMTGPLNILFGWIFGSLLSILPRKLCYKVHVWAEKDAAATYEKAASKVSHKSSPELFDALNHAALQEHQHAQRFQALLDDLRIEH